MREHIDWGRALADSSAVVRFQLLQSMPDTVPVSDETWAKLAADPEEAIRILAKQPRKR